ncbi:MAG: tRNA (adenine(22)-N(1))-methyltransferase, partial [Candidatus Sericytochromatia bacterium]
MTAPTLSRRLETILAMLRPGGTVVDVCADHGLVALAAVARGLADEAIAIDRAEAPLAVAAANREAAGLRAQVALRLGDGLAPLAEGEGGTLVLAGVGARLAVEILEAEPAKLSRFERAIVQPNQEPERVRAWALGAGWHLENEAVVAEDGRFFVVLAFRRAEGPDPAYARPGFTPEALCQIGPLLMSRTDDAARAYLDERRAWTAERARRQPSAAARLRRAVTPTPCLWAHS